MQRTNKHRRRGVRGCGERNPHQDSRRQNCGAISGCRGESCPAETAFFAPSLHRAFAGHSIWLQSGYMKNRKVVISWIQLYPAYNHFRVLTKYRKNEALIRNDGVYVISGIFCRANACVCGKNAFPPRPLAVGGREAAGGASTRSAQRRNTGPP